MRTRKALLNIISSIFLQLLVAVSGFIIPKLILSFYGSAVNGMINSISQFLAYAGLVEMGIGNASIVALYKPISEHNWTLTSSIVSTAKKKYYFSGIIYTLILCSMALLYPLIIDNQMDYGFTFSMVIIIGASNLVDYFILGKYRILLSALQKYYVLNIVRSVATIMTAILSAILILNNRSLVAVKGIAILVRVCEASFIKYYTVHKYSHVQYNNSLRAEIRQQRNSLTHQLASMIIYNTDLVILTICLPGNSLYEISVYTVYALVFGMITNLIQTLTNGMNATFGDMIVRGEVEKLNRGYRIYEYLYLIITFSAYTCFIALILPFVRCYTVNITDANYLRPCIGILFGIAGLAAQIKDAAGILIIAAGHFKQTQKYIVGEAMLNIVVSLILVRKYGIAGVMAGTIVSHIMANWGYIRYASKKILKRETNLTWKRIIRNTIVFVFLCLIEYHLAKDINGWSRWAFNGIFIAFINISVYFLINILFEFENFIKIKNYILNKIHIIRNQIDIETTEE